MTPRLNTLCTRNTILNTIASSREQYGKEERRGLVAGVGRYTVACTTMMTRNKE